MKHGFVKVRCISPDLRVADVAFNTAKLIQAIWDASDEGVKVVAFPELSVCGATCGDLLRQGALLRACSASVEKIAQATEGKDILAIVGAPILDGSVLYSCAIAINNGKILGVVPKTSLSEADKRYFSDTPREQIAIGEGKYPFGSELVFEAGQLRVGIYLGTGLTQSTLWRKGACVIVCPSADNALVGSDERKRIIAKAGSAEQVCAYLMANACEDESTTDTIHASHNIICECGDILAEAKPFESKNGEITTEIDIDRINAIRTRECVKIDTDARVIPFTLAAKKTTLTRKLDKLPFVAENEGEMSRRAEQILTMQAHALARRLSVTGSKSAVFGVSGGLDSTLTLLVIVRAIEHLGMSKDAICAVTMPCFGTTSRTKSNAILLCEELGIVPREIDICDSVRAHFKDIGHDESDHSVTYENAQARERTQILMDISNQQRGLVVGTGDLSEIALGWSTYNADHMSMYNPNCDIPKTLVRALVAYEAKRLGGAVGKILQSILDTPVSPELLPGAQETEQILGPYEHHDFFLYYYVRYGFAPSKIYRMAKRAFEGEASDEELYRELVTFIKRFITQQFKRSCSPDGVKVGSVALSPRTDMRLPSDATYWALLDELEANKDY